METGDHSGLTCKFVAISRCNNPDCKEITTIVGKTKSVLETRRKEYYPGWSPDYFDEPPDPEPDYTMVYEIDYTDPAIKLLIFPEEIHKEVGELIEDSFRLFWVDEASCGNKIRIVIEKLLNFQKVNKTVKTKNGKRVKLSLHKRIVLFKDKNPRVANYLLALKWLGNQASHGGKKLKRKDLMDAYKILELSLQELYYTKRSEVEKIAKKINKKKRV